MRYKVYQVVLNRHIHNCVGFSLTNVENCISSWQVGVITSKEFINVIYYLTVPIPKEEKKWFIIFSITQFNFGWGGIYCYWVLQKGHRSWHRSTFHSNSLHRSNAKFLLASLSLHQLNCNDIAGAASPSKNQYKLGNFLSYNLSFGLTCLMYLRV